MDQCENIFMVSKEPLKIERKPRLKFGGTSAGSVLGPVAVPSHSSMWSESVSEKKEIFGPARVAVGGRTAGCGTGSSEGGSTKIKPRGNQDIEPVFYHSRGQDVYAEILYMFGTKKGIYRIIDATPGDGNLAHLCCQMRIPYTGYAFTETHIRKLNKHLHSLVLTDFRTEGSLLYKNAYSTLVENIQPENGGGGSGEPESVPKPKAKGASKAKAKPKTKPQAKPKAKQATKKGVAAAVAAKKNDEGKIADDVEPSEEEDSQSEEGDEGTADID